MNTFKTILTLKIKKNLPKTFAQYSTCEILACWVNQCSSLVGRTTKRDKDFLAEQANDKKMMTTNVPVFETKSHDSSSSK